MIDRRLVQNFDWGLLAIVAAITLTMRKRPNLKVQDIAAQVAVQAKDRVRIVKMDAEDKQS